MTSPVQAVEVVAIDTPESILCKNVHTRYLHDGGTWSYGMSADGSSGVDEMVHDNSAQYLMDAIPTPSGTALH